MREKLWQKACNRVRDRLGAESSWIPAHVLVSGIASIVLLAFVMRGVDSRAGNPAVPLVFPAPLQEDTAIWISVTPIGEEVVITTNDRQVFRVPQQPTDDKAYQEFNAWLRGRTRSEALSAGIAGNYRLKQTKVIIRADQHLKYLHVRPLLYSLAAAGVTRYGFETDLSGTQDIAANVDTNSDPTKENQ